MLVVFAEKPSQAQTYAQVLGAKKEGLYWKGYWKGKSLAITNAIGHLIEISEPSKQNPAWEKWNQDDLPMIPEKIKVNIIEDKRKQFQIVRELFLQADEIINATDAGREGELIFRYVYLASGAKAPIKRLWTSDLTEKGLLKAFENLRDGKEFENIYYEAKARAEADWLVGMNASRAISIASRQSFPLGRVQTPTLALICERYLQYQNFVATPYYQLCIRFECENQKIVAKYDKNFSTKSEMSSILGELGQKTICTEIKVKQKIEKPPLPFSLIELQKECNRKLKLSPTETLEIAQSLYEKHKLISYPRTDSSYITENIYEELKNIFAKLSEGRFKSLLSYLPTPYEKHCVDDSKVTDHYAIIPTEKNEVGIELSEDEMKVYEMIIRRTIQALMPPCLKAVTDFVFENQGHFFYAQGVVIEKEGFRKMKTKTDNERYEDEDSDEVTFLLPAIKQGQVFQPTEPFIEELKTKPKPIHTGASLLAAMEHCSNDVEEKEIRDALKASEGIGRPSSRDSFIKLLIERGFVKVEKKVKLIPTEKGLRLYQAIKEHTIASPKLTGLWEMKLVKIGKGEYSYQKFLEEIKDYTRQITKELIEIGSKIESDAEKVGICPNCKKNNLISSVLIGKNSYYCEKNLDKSCDFFIPKNIKGVEIPKIEAIKLLAEGKTSLLKGFVFQTKEGKQFTADRYLVLNDKQLVFEIPQVEILDTPCPKCKQLTLENREKLIACQNTNCRFVLFKDYFGVKISKSSLNALLSLKKAPITLKSKEGKAYQAFLFLDDQFKLQKESSRVVSSE